MAKKRGAEDPTSEELEFIFQCFAENLTIGATLDEMQDEGFSVRSKRFMSQKKKEFDAAKKVLAIQLGKEIDPIIVELKRKHYKDLVKVSKALLSNGIDSIRFIAEDDYELQKSDIGRISLNRRELIQDLKNNLESVQQHFRSMDMFDYFKAHLEAEHPPCKNLEEFIETYPMELVNVLKRLCARGIFKGKCLVCQDF